MIIIKPLTIMAAKPTPPTPPTPSIPSVTIGNQIWSTVYVDPTISGIQSTHTETLHGQTIHYYTYPQLENVTFPDGWRIPLYDDCTTLSTYYQSNNKVASSIISTLDGGTDDYGLNLYLTGYWRESSRNNITRAYLTIAPYSGSTKGAIYYILNSNSQSTTSILSSKLNVTATPFRLVKDVT